MSAVTTRARGFASWTPYASSRRLLESVEAVLAEYAKYLPLTIRQIFYRLVGAHGYEKTERGYKNLVELLNRARRSRMIPFAAIRDDGNTEYRPRFWRDERAFVTEMAGCIESFRLDRQSGQSPRLIVLCEAAGLAPMIWGVTGRFHVPVLPSGGFDSLTSKYALAEFLSFQDSTEILHIGDHDPSGEHIFSSTAEDVMAFLEEMPRFSMPTFTRLAVTPDQVRTLSLPTSPPKETDRRSFDGLTTQVESIPPDVLTGTVLDAIESRVDREKYESVLAEERRIRTSLLEKLRPLLGETGEAE